MDVVEELVPRLAELPAVVAIVLGGSRATNTHRPDSDWDFGLYYRGSFDARLLAGLGYPGHVAQPGEWGRIVNGGAWLSVSGQPVDVLLRDLDAIERWWDEAQAGRFDIDNVEGHIAGLPTYAPIGEIALARPLYGHLPEVSFPQALRQSAEHRWRWCAGFSLLHARHHATTGNRTACIGMLARAVMQTAHGILAARGQWALNEKRLIDRADLSEAHQIIGTADVSVAVDQMYTLLDPPPLTELDAHNPG